MASHTRKDDFCLECHWEAFHLDGKNSEDLQGTNPSSQWNCAGEEHHASLDHCHVDETCCEVDTCSVNCQSVCDGFVDCDESTACSAAHCDDACDHKNCEDPDPACFDDQCFGSRDFTKEAPGTEHSLESLLGLGGPLNLESHDLISSTAMQSTQEDELPKAPGNPASGIVVSQPSAEHFIQPYAAAMPHYHPQNTPHFHCHDFPKETHDNLINPTYPLPNEVNPAEVFHMLGMCPDLLACQNFHVHEDQGCPSHSDKLNENAASDSLACFHIPHFNTNDLMKSPAHLNGSTSRGPCRSHHRCRTHGHAHAHPYSHFYPYSRHSRSSAGSQLLSSPGETPPPLDGGASSVLTSPEYSPIDRELHICRWATTLNGISTTCGATFPDPRTLQEHLVSRHMATVDGAKGTGYYCCWQGCHRPDEPFSQKSKLQGHFLTHSNYKSFKCSVCGKFFARQATLERHERSHRGEKPYRCSECGKSFTDSSELKTHSRTHTGEKPFKCTYPGCNFQTGDHMGCGDTSVYIRGATRALPDLDDRSTMSPMTENFELSFGRVA
ncbi:hypothetical protein EYZ11_005337 [Aspergillus tanneri]|uniref:C2H2-type domain-containing protein n=1 Tax=Aspergillus tanneri TaxID=1220188 RepID=A0A4S3JKM2_9EURO|nr:hypothetical protein EYZ11_005337 [Aspergillus tanneri]